MAENGHSHVPSSDQIKNYVIGAGLTTVFHPITYAKVLIQIGYEPIVPSSVTSIFGRKVLQYPNAFKYLAHIRKTDGFFGMYRGLSAKICGSIMSNALSSHMITHLKSFDKDDDPNAPDSVQKLFKETGRQMIATCGGVIVSQPFQVIMVRCMAQFIGKETKYSSLFSSISEIYESDGILGFFVGLGPRLLGEVIALWAASLLTYTFNNYIIPDSSKEIKPYTGNICHLLANQVVYPFTVVSNTMIVSNSGLVAGSPPYMENYGTWRNCWKALAEDKQLKRGSSLFFRRYNGPTIINYQGEIVPAPKYY